MRYRAKKDLAMIARIAKWYGGILLTFLLGIYYLTMPGSSWKGWLALCIGIASGVFILALTSPMYYEITPTTLHVRNGLIHREIALNSIQQVFPGRASRGVPAWSVDRLQVDYREGDLDHEVFIFPKDKFRFMQDIAEHAEELEVKDGWVVRRQKPTALWG
jgi:hypothetical protein